MPIRIDSVVEGPSIPNLQVDYRGIDNNLKKGESIERRGYFPSV